MLGLFLAVSARAAAEDGKPTEYKRSAGVGLAYMGGLLKYGFKKVWAAEAHYLFGNADTAGGSVSSRVIGLRGYRYFRARKALQFYAGPGAAFVTTEGAGSKSSGYMAGGFAGLEYYLRSWLSIGVDVGPYYTALKEDSLGTKESGIDFIANSFVNVYLF